MLNYKQIWHGIKPIRWLNKFNLTLCIINFLTILICKFFLIKFVCTRISIFLFILIFKSNTYGWANVFFLPLLWFHKLVCYTRIWHKKKRHYSLIWNLSIWELSSNVKNLTLWNLSSIENLNKNLNSSFLFIYFIFCRTWAPKRPFGFYWIRHPHFTSFTFSFFFFFFFFRICWLWVTEFTVINNVCTVHALCIHCSRIKKY